MKYDMSSLTVLLSLAGRCDTRWTISVMHQSYRDPPVVDDIEYPYDSPEAGFSARERQQYRWACTWRDSFHFYEEKVFSHPDFRQYCLDSTRRGEVTQYRYDRYFC